MSYAVLLRRPAVWAALFYLSAAGVALGAPVENVHGFGSIILGQLKLVCYPPFAKVYMPTGSGEQYLGELDGDPIMVTIPEGMVRTPLHLMVKADGYETHIIDLPASDPTTFDDNVHSIPSITLQPLSPWVPVRTLARLHPVVAAALGLLVLGAAGVAARHRRRTRVRLERGQMLESMVANNDDPNVGKLIGHYRLMARLGSGGMATVYRAFPDDLANPGKHCDQHVALKLVRPDMAKDPEFIDRFRREVRITTRLEHPNIVHILDCGEQEAPDGMQFYLVMELIDGQTLQSVVGGRALAETTDGLQQAFGYLQPLFEAVAYAHADGIVHRDLKPENLMLTRQGVLKVMDFGLAKRLGSSHKLTRTGTALGTPAYMAPEQISGNADPLPASDQYALGCLCYELFTGSVPFTAADPVSLMFKHFSDEARPMREKIPTLPEALDAAVLKMLAKQPQDRFGDVLEALNAMQAALGLRLSALQRRSANWEALGMRNSNRG